MTITGRKGVKGLNRWNLKYSADTKKKQNEADSAIRGKWKRDGFFLSLFPLETFIAFTQ